MAGFDISTAQPVEGGFDLSTATPVVPGKKEFDWNAYHNASKGTEKFAYDAGDKVSQLVSKIGLPPEVAGGAGYLTNLGLTAIPALFGGTVGTAAAPLVEAGAKSLMHSALKPGVKFAANGGDSQIVDTLLKEGINVTPGGVNKLRGAVDTINSDITSRIANSNATVNKNTVANYLNETIKKFQNQVTPRTDLNAIENAWTEFLTHPALNGKAEIPVQQAQELKQGTYQVLRNKYGQLGSADTEAQKTLARGLKEEIANQVPEVAGLNAREGALLKTLSPLERRVLVEANKNPVGISILAHNPAAWAAAMADRSGAFKSILARMAFNNSRAITGGTGAAVGLASDQMSRGQP